VLGQWGTLFVGGLFALFLVLAPFNLGSYTIDGDAVTGPQFLRQVGLVVAFYTAVLFAIGVGLWRERAWTRPLMIVYWLALPLLVLTSADWTVGGLVLDFLWSVAMAGIAWWYLYVRPNVVAYFEARKRYPVGMMPNER